jgi:hypothetical protein
VGCREWDQKVSVDPWKEIKAFGGYGLTVWACSNDHTFLNMGFLTVFFFGGAYYILSHSTSPFLWCVFSWLGLTNYLPGLASNQDPPDLCLLSS